MAPPPSTVEPTMLSTNFTGWNAPKVTAYTRKVVAKLTGHSAFPVPWPPWVASLELLTEKSYVLDTASLEAESHDTYKITKRNALTVDLKKDLKGSLKHVELVAQGNAELLNSLGLNMRRPPVKRKLPPSMLAPLLTVVQGKESGILNGKVVKCPGAKMYLVQICEGDPTVEANWERVDIFSDQAFQVTGRVPGRTYYLVSIRKRNVPDLLKI
jgi:hypothetical protein